LNGVGVDNAIVVNDIELSTSFTFSCWIKSSVLTDDYQMIFDSYDSSSSNRIYFALRDTGSNEITIFDSSTTHGCGVVGSLYGFTNYIVEVSDGNIKFYFNGTKNLDVDTGVSFNPRDTFYLFSNMGGYASNCRIYNGVLTEEQRQAIVNEGYHPRQLGDVLDGLTHFWPLHGSGEDYVGDKSFVTESNMSYSQFDTKGCVTNHNGSSSYLATDNTFGQEFFSGEASLSFWISPKALGQSSYAMSLHDDNNSNLPFLMLSLNSGNVFGYVIRTNSSDLISAQDTDTYAVDEIFHITFVISSTGYKIYKNKKLIHSLTCTPVFTSNSQCRLSFGALIRDYQTLITGYSNVRMWNGRCYNRALSENDVEKIYEYEKHIRPIPIDNGLKFFAPMDYDTQDNTEYQNPNAVTGAPSIYDNMIHFDTAGECAKYTNAIYGTNTQTFSCWVYQSSGTGYQTAMANFASWTGTYNGCIIGVRGEAGQQHLYVAYGDGTNSSGVIATDVGSFQYNTIYHIVATIDTTNGIINIYINGVLVKTATGLSSATMVAYRMYVGWSQYQEGASQTASSLIGGVGKPRHYERVLSEDEIKVIYNSEKGDFQ
jgi:hypothetical protein